MEEKKLIINSPNNPFILFKEWFDEAQKNEINDANAMNLSTISKSNFPSSRMVLLKDFDDRGFVFYTNIKSKKGNDIINNPNVSLNFHWKSITKQVRIEGKAISVSDKEADEYFNSRPKESRIGAWASNQSSKMNNREDLIKKYNFYKEKFKDGSIPRPDYWSGFRVVPRLIEFWKDMPFRLHHRLEFIKINNKWETKKLFP